MPSRELSRLTAALTGPQVRNAAADRRARLRSLSGEGSPPADRLATLDDRIRGYLRDPLLRRMYDEIEAAGRLRAITVDITHVCNIRCQGCYFFVEEMDNAKSPKDEDEFEGFISAEKARGTNFITVLGGEPSLVLERLKRLHDEFVVTAVTNGIRRIPAAGFETLPIAVSVWGDHETDTAIRGGGKLDVFARALRNYKDDPRVLWYYTVSAGNANEVESVVSQCVDNGNYVYFNYYEDNAHIGGRFDHALGFDRTRRAVDRMIERYPDRILTTHYLNQVATTSRLYDMEWGYDVCPTISANYEKNRDRVANGNVFNAHFRAYNPDLRSVRRCCVGEDRDCSQCYNVYARHTWIVINKRRHLETELEFTNWLTSAYVFYLTMRAVDFEAGAELLPEIHSRLRAARSDVSQEHGDGTNAGA
jgi:MoaA/NifB/PqqE/SkfB family radical SAM enzyme